MLKAGLMAIAACALATSASAADNPFAQDKATLHLTGLDLSTPEGQERLAIRMDQAARAVCGDRLATVHLALAAKANECRTSVVADIRNQIETRMAETSNPSRSQIAFAN